MDDITFRRCFPNFFQREFKCPCSDCDGGRMEFTFLCRLQDLRSRCDIPFTITSGFRCPSYNSTLIGSVEKSYHTLGLACDISTASLDGKKRHKLIKEAMQSFTGVGLYKNFIHLDLRPNKEKTVWVGSTF